MLGKLLYRACLLRCLRCGRGDLFAGWFRMHPACPHCGLPFEREPGFYLGSIYVNYGLTSLIVIISFVGLSILGVSADHLLWTLTAFCVLFPLWFFRYARALWLGLDQFFDPRRDD